MKNLMIRCFSSKTLASCFCYIEVYNCNKIVFQCYTNKYGVVQVKNLPDGFYKIIAINSNTGEKVIMAVYLKENRPEKLNVLFDTNYFHPIIFNLIDEKYHLPIKEGEIRLWQKNI